MKPDLIEFFANLEVADLAVASRLVLEASSAAGVTPVIEWAIPVGGRGRKQGLQEALAKLAGTEAARQETVSLRLELANGWTGKIVQPYEQPGLRKFYLWQLIDPSLSNLPAILMTLSDVCRELLKRVPLHSARVTWRGGGAECLPEVPIAGMRDQLVVTSETEVNAAYERPDVFWNAWDASVDYGDKVLLTRALEVNDSVQLLQRLIAPQWEMARAARPGLCKYFNPIVEPEERDLYLAGESPLEDVGYLTDEKLAEMSCVLPPGEHIPGWQIHTLLQRLEKRELADGRPLEAIRVVFFTREMAEQEKRPLLDIGVRVYFQDISGEIVEIES